jgi:dipeptidyl aminopeptidase/acylaminoacyl peptidase
MHRNLVRLALPLLLLMPFSAMAASPGFTIPQVLSAPFAGSLVAGPDGRQFAWVSNHEGRRNVWLATGLSGGAGFTSRAVTHYMADDGLEISDLAFVPKHDLLLFVRGGDVEYPDKAAPNPAALPGGVVQSLYRVDLRGGAPVMIGAGHAPVVSPTGERIVYLLHGEAYAVAPRGNSKPERLFTVRGAVISPRFSPDGTQLAFVSHRGDHSFIGIYTFATRAVHWVDASLSFDLEPRWSQDGQRVAFVRLPSTHDEVGLIAHRTGAPWSIRVASVADGRVHEAYRAPHGIGSVFHPLSSDAQLFWRGDHIVFPAESDGWLHLYDVPASGDETAAARLLTPGAFEIEYATASTDGETIVYASNAGDIDRRHLWRLRPADASVEPLTPGEGIETQPVMLADGRSIAFLRADARVPMHAAALAAGTAATEFLAEGLPQDFPSAALVVPQSVTLPARGGIAAHGQLFLPPGLLGERHPAVIFMHGGPVRQMLAGWHYMDYYSNAYAMNQYLASRGYVVLSLNYRAGIGYGLDFREADGIGASGAAEYNDLLSAAELLRQRPDVRPDAIGLWGGSYGGYMTALGLARNSDLFAAGADLHGVHDWHHWTLGERDEHPLYILDTEPAVLAAALAASPIASIEHWRSPVLLVHGDDDHNVAFSETVRLAELLRAHDVPHEELVFPDEIHGFLRHASWIRTYEATAAFLDRRLAAPHP